MAPMLHSLHRNIPVRGVAPELDSLGSSPWSLSYCCETFLVLICQMAMRTVSASERHSVH